MSPEGQRRINKAAAVIVPALVLGFAAYVSWATTEIVCSTLAPSLLQSCLLDFAPQDRA